MVPSDLLWWLLAATRRIPFTTVLHSDFDDDPSGGETLSVSLPHRYRGCNRRAVIQGGVGVGCYLTAPGSRGHSGAGCPAAERRLACLLVTVTEQTSDPPQTKQLHNFVGSWNENPLTVYIYIYI